MNLKSTLILAAVISGAAPFVNAQTTAADSRPAATSAAAMTAGEVRKVDLEQSKVTIKHEPITNLDMPPMTMVFRVAQPELLKELKTGDRVQFHAENRDGSIVVTHIQPQK